MKNQIGFITKKYIQPDYYGNFFNCWAGIYIIGDEEYHLQAVSDPYDTCQENIEEFEILKQFKNGRLNINPNSHTYRNIRDAIKEIEHLKAYKEVKIACMR